MLLHFFSFFLNSESSLEESFFEFNFNLFETNIVNIALLVGLLIYGNKISFRNQLKERRETIILVMENAQKDLVRTFRFYNNIEEETTQVKTVLQSWKTIYQNQKEQFVETKYGQVLKGVNQTFLTTQLFVQTLESKAYFSLQQYFIYIVATRILRTFLLLSPFEKSRFLERALSRLEKK